MKYGKVTIEIVDKSGEIGFARLKDVTSYMQTC